MIQKRRRCLFLAHPGDTGLRIAQTTQDRQRQLAHARTNYTNWYIETLNVDASLSSVCCGFWNLRSSCLTTTDVRKRLSHKIRPPALPLRTNKRRCKIKKSFPFLQIFWKFFAQQRAVREHKGTKNSTQRSECCIGVLLIEVLAADVIICIHLKRLLILGRKRFRSSSPVIARLTLLLVLIMLTTIGSCTICGSSSTGSYLFIYYYIFLCAKLSNLFLSSKFLGKFFFCKAAKSFELFP